MRRLTSLDAKTPDEFIDVECRNGAGLDLKLSIYLAIEGEVTQVAAEHAASFIGKPEARASLAVLPTDDDLLETDPGMTWFAFTRKQHRSVELFDRAALRAFVSRAFPSDEHLRSTSITELGQYIAGRLALNDSEWIRVCDDNSRKKWKRLAAKHAAPDPQLALEVQQPDGGQPAPDATTSASGESPPLSPTLGHPDIEPNVASHDRSSAQPADDRKAASVKASASDAPSMRSADPASDS